MRTATGERVSTATETFSPFNYRDEKESLTRCLENEVKLSIPTSVDNESSCYFGC